MQLDGRIEVVRQPEAIEALVEYYRSISGEHPDWDEYRQAMADQGKVLLRLTIDRGAPSAGAAFQLAWSPESVEVMTNSPTTSERRHGDGSGALGPDARIVGLAPSAPCGRWASPPGQRSGAAADFPRRPMT